MCLTQAQRLYAVKRYSICMIASERLPHLNHTTWNGVLQGQSTDCSARYSYTARHFRICAGGMSVGLTGVTMSDLNQKILPCFKTNHLQIDDGDHIYSNTQVQWLHSVHVQ